MLHVVFLMIFTTSKKSSSPEARKTVKQMLFQFTISIPSRLLGDTTAGQAGKSSHHTPSHFKIKFIVPDFSH